MNAPQNGFIRTNRSDRVEIAAAHIASRMLHPEMEAERAVAVYEAVVEKLRAERAKAAARTPSSPRVGEAEGAEKLPRLRPAEMRELIASILTGGLITSESSPRTAIAVFADLQAEIQAVRLRRRAEVKKVEPERKPLPLSLVARREPALA